MRLASVCRAYRLQPSEARMLTVRELDAFHRVLERERAEIKRR